VIAEQVLGLPREAEGDTVAPLVRDAGRHG